MWLHSCTLSMQSSSPSSLSSRVAVLISIVDAAVVVGVATVAVVVVLR